MFLLFCSFQFRDVSCNIFIVIFFARVEISNANDRYGGNLMDLVNIAMEILCGCFCHTAAAAAMAMRQHQKCFNCFINRPIPKNEGKKNEITVSATKIMNI